MNDDELLPVADTLNDTNFMTLLLTKYDTSRHNLVFFLLALETTSCCIADASPKDIFQDSVVTMLLVGALKVHMFGTDH